MCEGLDREGTSTVGQFHGVANGIWNAYLPTASFLRRQDPLRCVVEKLRELVVVF